MNNIILPVDLFDAARLPSRDENGYVYHPDWNLIFDGVGIDDEGEVAAEYIRSLGYEFKNVDFADDATEELVDAYYFQDSVNISAWEPSGLNGNGWMLLGIYDSEDGPVACYVRKKADGKILGVINAKIN